MGTRTMEKEINEHSQRPVFKYVVKWLLFKNTSLRVLVIARYEAICFTDLMKHGLNYDSWGKNHGMWDTQHKRLLQGSNLAY